ncbi:MAG: hypothetical protein IPL53_23650 [Ignavibacteria bacterium]|nr:hypothetical protein [Ignavibacteria bacterium]
MNSDISQFSIIKIIKKFSSKEISEFEKLINSPFFNNHSTVSKLFKELKKHHPKFSDSKLTKEFLFNSVNKGEKYNDLVFQKYMSRLNKLSEEYLNILNTRAEPHRFEFNILNQLSKLGVGDIYKRKLKEIEKSINEESKIDSDYFLLKHHLTDLNNYNLKISKLLESFNQNVIDSYNNLLAYFIFVSGYTLNQLNLNNYSIKNSGFPGSSGIFFNNEKFPEFLNDILKNTKPSDKKRILFLNLVEKDFNLNFGKKDLTAYYNLKKLVYENSDLLQDKLLLFYLKRMIAFCIIHIGSGKDDLNTELFRNYKLLLEKGLFEIGGTSDMQILDFRLIVSSSLKIMNPDGWKSL